MRKATALLGLICLTAGLQAQAPPGYHLTAPISLPDSLTETMLGGRFRATVVRDVRNARERQLLEIAERLVPSREMILGLARDSAERRRLVGWDTVVPRPSPDTTGRPPTRPAGAIADRWWTEPFDGTWMPFALTGTAVRYYLLRLQDEADGLGVGGRLGPDGPDHGEMVYRARIETTTEGGAAFVVRMRLGWEYWCGMLCAVEFSHQREVWFDAKGKVLRVTGDGRPMVVAS